VFFFFFKENIHYFVQFDRVLVLFNVLSNIHEVNVAVPLACLDKKSSFGCSYAVFVVFQQL